MSGEIDSAVALAEIAGKFDIMLQNIETVKDRQEDMAQDIAHIREASNELTTCCHSCIIEL